MGDDPLQRPGPGKIPTQGTAADHGEAAVEYMGRELGITYDGDGDAGSGVRRDGGVCAEEIEYGHAIHRDATDFGTLRGDSTDARDVGEKKVVGTSGPVPGGSEGGVGGRGRI